METESKVFLISFVVLGIITYLHALGIFDPFKQLPILAWIWVTIGIALGLLLERGLEKI